MPITTPVQYGKFTPASQVARAKSAVDWEDIYRDATKMPLVNFNTTKVTTKYDQVKEFVQNNGTSNPDFAFNKYQRIPNDITTDPKITRGYIRRTDPGNDGGGASLNFMFNPEQIVRDYVSYLDQAALDPFNTLYQSGNLVNPPSFVNFSFSLFFDRQDDMMANKEKFKRGVLVDYDYFDLVVRNVVPSDRGSTTVPDNGVMMVNPKDITVVFSKDLSVQGRPTNARVTFAKFDHKMVPTRMQVDLTMIITYFGPLRSPFGLDTFQAIKQYEALVPYSDTVEEGFTEADLEVAVKNYNNLKAERASTSGSDSVNQSWFGRLAAGLSSGAVNNALAQVGTAQITSAVPNDQIRGAALMRAYARSQTVPEPAYSSPNDRLGPEKNANGRNSYDCSGFIWACYNDIGAHKAISGSDSPSDTASIAAYQKSINWATMPVIVNGGQATADIKQRCQNLLQPGDVLLRRDSKGGHIAFFAGWANSQRTRANLVHARGRGYGVGPQERSLDYVAQFNWCTRPTLAGSSSSARGLA